MSNELPIIGSPLTEITDGMNSNSPCQYNPSQRYQKVRRRRRYYNLGMIARITADTTDAEFQRLLQNEARTFLLTQNFITRVQYDNIFTRTIEAIREYESDNPFKQSLAFEFRGDGCYFGRIRNGCSLYYYRGDILTLTANDQYKNSCYKEIAYASNLAYYIPNLCLRDFIYIGDEVYGLIVRLMKHTVSVCLLHAGTIRSYDYIVLPKKCYITATNHEYSMFEDDLIVAETIEADFVLIPRIRSKPYLQALRRYYHEKHHTKVIGVLDYQFIMLIASQLKYYLKLLDYLLIPDAFYHKRVCINYIYSRVIPIAKQMNLPIIGKVPIESCCEFKKYENHRFVAAVDAYFLEKSEQCRRYPLVVKHLKLVKKAPNDFKNSPVVAKMPLEKIDDMLKYILEIVETMNCRIIIIYTSHREILKPLTERKIYCPVYVMLPLESKKDSNSFTKNTDTLRFAKSMNLYRNLKGIVYDDTLNIQKFPPIEYGVHLAQKQGILLTCDLVVTLEEKQEDDDGTYKQGESSLTVKTLYVLPTDLEQLNHKKLN